MNSVVEKEQEEKADDLRMLAESVAAFMAKETSLKRVRDLRSTQPGFDRSIWQKLAGQGWLGVLIPEQYGGLDLGFAEMRVIAEGLARGLIPEPLVPCAVLARGAILHGQNEALRAKLLPGIASGALIAGLAHVDLDGMPTVAIRSGTKWSVSGAKRFVTPAAGADGYAVLAHDGGQPVLLWVVADAEGLNARTELRADGTYCATLTLKNVIVPADQLIAEGTSASDAVTRAEDETVFATSAELFGVMDQALGITLEYLRTRVQFGKPIGSFQALQHRAVDLFILKELAISALADATHAMDNGDARARSRAASRVKSRCADAAMTITRESIKLHGAIGFADECDIGLYFQRTLVLTAWLGNGALQRRRFSRLIRSEAAIAPEKGRVSRVRAGRAVKESPADTDWNSMSDEAFRQEVRNYFEAYYPEHLRYLNRRARWSETRDWALRMSRKGWIAPAWPREHGGMGLSPSKLIIYMEEQERWGVARAPDQGVLMLGPVLMRFGTEEQKRMYLPSVISCEHIWSQGYSEPNAGSDLASLRTEAIQDGDEFVINGTKTWSTLAQDATHMFLLARTNKTVKRQDGISFFLLDFRTPGVRVRPIRNIEGHEEFCEVFFYNVRIPKNNLVGELNKGWMIAKTLLGFERLNHGSPRRAQYPLQKIELVARKQGIWDDAEFQSKYVRLRLDVEDLAASYARFADIVRSGKNPGAVISFLKIWATETFQRLTELLIELSGEAGSLRGEVELAGDLVDVLGPHYCVFPATIAAGSNEIQRNILARQVLALPR